MPWYLLLILGFLLSLFLPSCHTPESSIPAREALHTQAEQNRRLAELQQTWMQERQELFRQRDTLERERAEWATARVRDPVIAAAILRVGELALCVTPLALCWMLLRTSTSTSPDELLAEVLLEAQLATPDSPVLRLEARPAAPLSHSPPSRLTGPTEATQIDDADSPEC
ncbi:hypothetical protein Plim_1093 [Planctopirus limnophila DSM 3776]|uniref:Uncharacterized protein n=1 Tax=Planctopirus limnophila (strain ATCC 43296 / DSM 3776 / IFAM 1008 / Mu 290) TaxID=521674 RepID=D5STU5_PLAL2|nr:hypothetical protein [Planctopirus limnophila]ADG66930.1 hypothetical protein Plim_1093 [Planctopirus limnophila DSM 3776]